MGKKRYKTRFAWLPTALGLALFAILAVLIVKSVARAGSASDREELQMAERAVRQAAVSVYAMEGAYPASYEELRERTGIAVNDDKYVVFYEIFASNIMPEITVVERRALP